MIPRRFLFAGVLLAALPAAAQPFGRPLAPEEVACEEHRFQILAWTILLGIMFVSSVYNDLTMPEFSATLLSLIGISSETYIGFKFPEQK